MEFPRFWEILKVVLIYHQGNFVPLTKTPSKREGFKTHVQNIAFCCLSQELQTPQQKFEVEKGCAYTPKKQNPYFYGLYISIGNASEPTIDFQGKKRFSFSVGDMVS